MEVSNNGLQPNASIVKHGFVFIDMILGVGSSKRRDEHTGGYYSTKPAYYRRLLSRFPNGLTKHQWCKIVDQLLPEGHQKDMIINAIHDSLDLAFENGFAQGQEVK